MLGKIRNNKIISAIAGFIDKKYFPFIAGAVIAVLHITGLNEAGFIFIGLLLSFINICSPNIRPAIPVVFTAVLVVSTRAEKMETTVDYFTAPAVIAVIAVVVVSVIVTALLRLYFDKSLPACFKKRRLTYGFIAFSAVLVLGGVGTPYFAVDSLGLAFSMILTGLVFYMFFSGTLVRRDDDMEYLGYSCMTVAAVIIVELVALYIRVYKPGMPLDSAFKDKLFIGWGISNPIGELSAFMLAPTFMFAYKKKHGWLYYIFAAATMAAVYLSLSRNALLIGGAAFVVMTIVCIIGSKNRIGISAVAGAIAVALIFTFSLGKNTEAVKNVFAFFKDAMLNDRGRFELWRRFMGYFAEYPVLGAGFAACGSIGKASMKMAHNTIFQILGSCGVVGMIAHVYHRVQTVLIFTKKPNVARTAIGGALLTYVLMGLLDPIYFFANFTLYYTIMLVFSEKDLERSLENETAIKAVKDENLLPAGENRDVNENTPDEEKEQILQEQSRLSHNSECDEHNRITDEQ